MRNNFVSALKAEMKERKDYFKDIDTGSSPATIYIGGGTPSVLTERQLAEIIETAYSEFGLSDVSEFTMEVNPDDITVEYGKFLRSLGINRISMGEQSFMDSHLKMMNRRHSASEGIEAFTALRKAGFDNISLDLIFGFSGLGKEEWIYNLNKAAELSPEHISAYQMSIEPGSILYDLAGKGNYSRPEEETCAEEYEILQNIMQEKGYTQYEVSNFARPGFESQHNSSYWNFIPYIGLGPSAHSYKRTCSISERRWNLPSLSKYCSYYLHKHKGSEKISSGEILTAHDEENEKFMLGLRQIKGLPISEIKGYPAEEIEEEKRSGNLIEQNGYLKIPSEKMFISDNIIRNLFK
jgi:oxygen-independent coproporphyrinogen-3 oxidase